MSDTIQLSEVLRLAELAHLALGEDEARRVARDLDVILHHVRTLESLDLEGVAPTTSVQLGVGALRADEPGEELDRDLALREAPRVVEGGFAVPAFVDEGGGAVTPPEARPRPAAPRGDGAA